VEIQENKKCTKMLPVSWGYILERGNVKGRKKMFT
jgi:hypothetical protein